MEELGLRHEELRRIVLTHFHDDHAVRQQTSPSGLAPQSSHGLQTHRSSLVTSAARRLRSRQPSSSCTPSSPRTHYQLRPVGSTTRSPTWTSYRSAAGP